MGRDAYYLYYCKHTERYLKTIIGSTCSPYKILCNGCKHLVIDSSHHNQMSCEFGEFPESRTVREWIEEDKKFIDKLKLELTCQR